MSDAPAADAGPSDGRRLWQVALLFLALTIVLAWPFSLHPGTRVLSSGTDTDYNLWALAWDIHALIRQPWAIFDANIFYPHAHTLAYSENLIGSAFLGAPILWLTGNPVLAMNLVSLAATVIGGVGAWFLARRLGLGMGAAVLAGLIFAFSPPRFLRLDQFHLATVEWIPWALAFLHKYLDDGRSRDLKWAAALFTLQALTSGHGAVFLAIAMLALLGYRVATGTPIAIGRRLRDLGVTGALFLVPAALMFLPYHAVQAENPSLRRTLLEWDVNAASFFSSPSHVQTWLMSFAPEWMTKDPSAYLFPGILPIALALAAIGISRARRRSTLFYGVLLLLCFLLMLGPPYGLWRFVYWLPGLNFIRIPSRISILAVLALAMVAAAGFERLSRRLSGRSRAIAAVVMGALLVAEFAAGPLQGEPYRAEMPAADRWLNSRPKPFVVAEVPLPDSRDITIQERRLTLYMQHSMAHWQKTVHGFSGIEPPEYRALYWRLVTFPDEASLKSLTDLGVTYVVVHFDLYPAAERAENEARFAAWQNRLTLEYQDSDARVYSLRRP